MHLINLTLIKCLDWKKPHEVLLGTRPIITHLKVFGCAAYVYLPKEKRANKLVPRSELMTYIGWVTGIKEFRLMWPSGVIFMGATATFDETLFPHMGVDIIPTTTGFGKYPDNETKSNFRQGDLYTPGTNSGDEPDNSPSDQSYSPFCPLHNSHKGIKYYKGKSK